jgi:hypothetical protein
MKKVQDSGLSAGKDPMGIVGAVIYLSLPKSDENIRQHIITQAVIAEAAGISEVTIRMYTKKLRKDFHYDNYYQIFLLFFNINRRIVLLYSIIAISYIGLYYRTTKLCQNQFTHLRLHAYEYLLVSINILLKS